MKLTLAQRKALEWLAKGGPWRASWWGGDPHTGWPKEMRARTCECLLRDGYVIIVPGEKAFERIAQITPAGRSALGEK